MNKIFDIHPPRKIEIKKKEEVEIKEEEEVRKRKEFFEGRPKKNGVKRKFLVVFSAFLIVLLFFGLLRMVSSEKEFKKNFFATKCSGEWQNPANAEGIPDVLPYGTIDSFSEGNSAVYETGPKNLLCQWFNELPEVGEEQKKDPCGKDYELCNLTSTKIHLSFAIDNINDDYSMDGPKEEGFLEGAFGSLNQEEIANKREKSFENINDNTLAELTEAVQAQEENQTEITPTDIVSPNSPVERPEATITQTATPTEELIPTQSTEMQPTEEQLNLDARIILSYSLDNGKTWNAFESIKTVPFSNYLNGGYIILDAPFIKNWYDIENFRIRLEGIVGGEEKIIAYLDSVWLEAIATKQFKAPGEITREISEKIFSMFQDSESKVLPEKLEIIQKEFEYEIPGDGRIIGKVINNDKAIDGIFRIHFLSKENNVLLSTMVLAAGHIKNFEGFDVPSPEAAKLEESLFSESIDENEMGVGVKKEWGKVNIKIEYIPLVKNEKLSLDNIELFYLPEKILIDQENLIEEFTFEPQEKDEKEVIFSALSEGEINIYTINGKGNGAFVIYLNDKNLGIIEIADKEQVFYFPNIDPGEYTIKVKYVDYSWDDNEGKRILKFYFKEKKDDHDIDVDSNEPESTNGELESTNSKENQ